MGAAAGSALARDGGRWGRDAEQDAGQLAGQGAPAPARALTTACLAPPPPACPPTGGNAGFSSLLFKLLWPGATVVALEPDPSNFAVLRRNTAGCVRACATSKHQR